MNKRKREEYLKSLADRNKYLASLLRNREVAKIALALLYVGEGAKWRSHRGLHLGSSDPDIVAIYLKLLERCYGISKERLRARIIHRADQNIDSLTKYWSSLTGMPRKHFYKTKPDPRTIGKKTTKKDYRGVCVISGGGTEVQLELDIIAGMFLKK
ncbi:hypothetical protein IID24_01040 [Patescibacteria group bacterium]|nr:hypothetical protein [Patescibacteria group bacterium]